MKGRASNKTDRERKKEEKRHEGERAGEERDTDEGMI